MLYISRAWFREAQTIASSFLHAAQPYECEQYLNWSDTSSTCRPHFVSSSFNVLVGLFAEALAARLEVRQLNMDLSVNSRSWLLVNGFQGIILSELRFSQLGGLQLEREIRRLTLNLSSAFPHASVCAHFVSPFLLICSSHFCFLTLGSRELCSTHANGDDSKYGNP